MLPENWITAFSLDAGAYRPAVSIYFDVDGEFNVGEPTCKIEAVNIAANLRIQAIEPHFNAETGLDQAGEMMFAHHQDLIWFYQFATALQKRAANTNPTARRNTITASNWMKKATSPSSAANAVRPSIRWSAR